jgi:hypothetical protein
MQQNDRRSIDWTCFSVRNVKDTGSNLFEGWKRTIRLRSGRFDRSVEDGPRLSDLICCELSRR